MLASSSRIEFGVVHAGSASGSLPFYVIATKG